MENLIKKLKGSTQNLKEDFVNKTKKWAFDHYDMISKRRSWRESDWCKYLNIEPVLINEGSPSEFLGFPKGFYGTKNARILDRLQNEVRSITSKGREKYIELQIKKAEMHYEISVEKLANRIIKKGINTENVTVVSGHVGINLETIISDGDKVVKAWTIVAEGEIQRPHYRYLIK